MHGLDLFGEPGVLLVPLAGTGQVRPDGFIA